MYLDNPGRNQAEEDVFQMIDQLEIKNMLVIGKIDLDKLSHLSISEFVKHRWTVCNENLSPRLYKKFDCGGCWLFFSGKVIIQGVISIEQSHTVLDKVKQEIALLSEKKSPIRVR